jgi:hypothetical protein
VIQRLIVDTKEDRDGILEALRCWDIQPTMWLCATGLF